MVIPLVSEHMLGTRRGCILLARLRVGKLLFCASWHEWRTIHTWGGKIVGEILAIAAIVILVPSLFLDSHC